MHSYALEKGAVRCYQAVGTTDISTSSSSYVDMTDMSITFTLRQKKDVMIFFTGVVFNGSHQFVKTAIVVDGTVKCEQSYYGTVDGEGREQIPGIWKENLSAGQHTIKMQWKAVGGGTASCFGASDAPRVLQVLEMGADQENPVAITGQMLQFIRTEDSTGRTLSPSKAIPSDNTVPLSDEGIEYTQLATNVTPNSSINRLLIEVEVCMRSANASNGGIMTMALFDGTTCVRASDFQNNYATGTRGGTLKMTHSMVAGTASLKTFHVRVSQGAETTTLYVNADNSGNALYGGVMISSLTITEIAG